MGVDCSTFVGFVAEAVRLCEQYDSCVKCPFGDSNTTCPRDIFDRQDTIGSTMSVLQKWSDEHPMKTRLDDLKEKYPKFEIHPNGYPCLRPIMFGYCKDCGSCTLSPTSVCWDEPVEGGATGKAVE